MGFLTNKLVQLGLLKHDLDYHLIRASMVIIFFFFGYQKWFEYEAHNVDSLHPQWPSDFLDVPGLWNPWSQRSGLIKFTYLLKVK